jgi:hypothetical protein
MALEVRCWPKAGIGGVYLEPLGFEIFYCQVSTGYPA